MKIGDRIVRFLLDCGATVNLVPASLVNHLGSVHKHVRSPEANLRMFDEPLLQTDGMVTASNSSKDRSVRKS